MWSKSRVSSTLWIAWRALSRSRLSRSGAGLLPAQAQLGRELCRPFAAKEAAAKALGTGISFGVNWLEIEVVREPSGRPSLRFHGRAAQIAGRLGVVRSALSLTHTAQLAMASVLLEDEQ
jgi:holo-[acyl-carrier-protein] synthase